MTFRGLKIIWRVHHHETMAVNSIVGLFNPFGPGAGHLQFSTPFM